MILGFNVIKKRKMGLKRGYFEFYIRRESRAVDNDDYIPNSDYF